MSADGVSMPTTLSQLGRVAKTQAKAQQPAAVAPHEKAVEKDAELKVRQVRELEKAAQQRVEADRKEEKDRRKRRRLKRRAGREQEHAGEESDADRNQDTPAEGGDLGVTIDILV